MWLKILTLLTALVPWIIEKIRKDRVREELLQAQELTAQEDIKNAKKIRANATSDELLLNPKDRTSNVYDISTNICRKHCTGSCDTKTDCPEDKGT